MHTRIESHLTARLVQAVALCPIVLCCVALGSCASTDGGTAEYAMANEAGPTVAVAPETARPEDGDPLVEAVLADAEESIAAILAVPDGQRTYANTVGAIDDLHARVFRDAWIVVFLANVHPDPDVRERGTAARRRIVEWDVDFWKRRDLYAAVRAYADTEPELAGERARLLEHMMRDYRRAGMDLPPDELAELTEVEKEMSRLGTEFSKNIREDDTALLFSAADLAGVPADHLASLDRSGELYVVTRDYPTTGPVFDYCEVPETRQKLIFALRRRARPNVAILEELIQLRQRQAQLLGYETTAHFVTETRMAKDPANVMAFYDELRPKLRRKSLADLEEFTAAKREHTGDPEAVLYAWDRSFYENRLLQSKYQVDSEKVREYFPIEACIEGLFEITQSMYGIEYRDVTAENAGGDGRWPAPWHEDVELYEVYDTESGDLLGAFFFDLHPRQDKYSHAAKFGLRPRKVWPDGSITLPLCALVCNFTKPTPDKPALMTHDEVETLFHEFGHCLHNLLTEAETNAFEGTTVARDFVEAPSQMFEEWIWNADVLASFSRHYETGQPIPADLVQGMLAARYLGSGMKAEGQLYLGLMDMRFHTDPDGEVDTTQVLMDTYRECMVYAPMEQTYSQASFGHLVGYQAGYYGYLWSLVYAADMASRFKAEGLLNPELGREYREKILSKGGTVDEIDMVRSFLGRDPQPDAFLESLGLKRP